MPFHQDYKAIIQPGFGRTSSEATQQEDSKKKMHADHLAGVFISIFNEFLILSVVPTYFKRSTIGHIPKNNKPLMNYRPVAQMLIVMKVFEKLAVP